MSASYVKSELKMGVIRYRWCLFSVQIILMFAVISSVLPTAESTSAPETSSTAEAITTIQTATVTTTRLATAAPTPPERPAGVTVLSVSSERLHVSWNSSETANYYLVYVNDTLNQTVNMSESTSCYVDRLKGGTHYVIGVEACVPHDVCSNATEAEGSTYPAKPGNFSLTDRSSSSFSLNWTQHDRFDHFVVNVSYDWHHNVTNDIKITPTGTNSDITAVQCDIRGLLVPGGNYSVIVSAFANTPNSLRNDSQPNSFLTKPDQPQNVTITNRTKDSLLITWSQFGVVETFSWSVNDTNMTHSDILIPPSNNTGCYPCNSSEVYLNVSGLQTAGEMYSIVIIAIVTGVTSDPMTVSYATVPNEPESFSSKTVSSENISLSWTVPAGHVESYELSYTNGSVETSLTTPISASAEAYNLTGLPSDSNYTIKLRSKSYDQTSSDYVTTHGWTFPDKVTEVKDDPQEMSVHVTWKPPQRHTHVCLYQLIIAQTSDCVQRVDLFCHKPCPTPIPGTCSSNRSDDNFNCNETLSYTFEGLKYSTEYNITIAAVNPGGSGQPELITVQTVAEIVKDNSWIAGVVIGCLLAILLIIAIVFLFLRWRQDKSPFGGRNRSPSMSEKGGEENLVYEEEPEPVAVEAFVDYTKKMSQDSNYLYACEYMLLAKLSAKNTTVAAELPDNRIKNRYTDILPYDNSRVKLIPDEDGDEGDGSDYINASFMPGFNSQREYIAAQGPMRSTVDDFWLMIWQQEVNMVVMVTNLTERGREKCEQYWPDDNEPLCYGNINVLLKSESSQDFYTIRVLEVSLGSEMRQIFQYHFLTWPDFGVPEDMEHILTFVKDIRNSIQGTAPVLVHCSAGVGRTGTFIVVDHLLQLIKRESRIDLFHLVLDLRQHRPKMIQAESQYVFAHECIKMAIEKGLHRDSSMIIDEDEQAANGECLYVNASETKEKTVSLYANATAAIPVHLQTYQS